MRGLDISKHQGNINLSKLDFDFVIVRSSYGDGYADAKFEENYGQAVASGKPRGVYHYSYPNTGNTAKAEAEWFLKVAQKAIGDGILVLDYEYKSKDYVSWCLEWLEYVKKKTGVTPFLYTYQNILDIYNWSEVARAGYPLWIAKYNSNNGQIGAEPNIKWWTDYAIWQYTDNGVLAGHSGTLDLDIAKIDVTTWNKYAGQTAQTLPNTKEEKQDMDFKFYGVNNEQELKNKVIEHLGESDGTCSWGDADKGGGFLGSERRSNQKLREENTKLQAKIDTKDETITTLKAEKKELQTQVKGLTAENKTLLSQNEALSQEVEDLKKDISVPTNTSIRQALRNVIRAIFG